MSRLWMPMIVCAAFAMLQTSAPGAPTPSGEAAAGRKPREAQARPAAAPAAKGQPASESAAAQQPVRDRPGLVEPAGKGLPPSEFIYCRREVTLKVDYPADWKRGDRRPVMIYFYGGPWEPDNSKLQMEDQTRYFVKRGMVAVRANCRTRIGAVTSPHTYIQDSFSVIRWLRKNAEMLGINPDRIVGSGGSGSSDLMANPVYAPEDDLTISPIPNALIPYHPVFLYITEGMMIRMLDTSVAKRMPPTLVFMGTEDPSYEELMAYVGKAKEIGVPIETYIAEGEGHTFWKYSPWLEKTTLRADEFLQSIGFLSSEPKVEPPTLIMTESQRAQRTEQRKQHMQKSGGGGENIRQLMEARKKNPTE